MTCNRLPSFVRLPVITLTMSRGLHLCKEETPNFCTRDLNEAAGSLRGATRSEVEAKGNCEGETGSACPHIFIHMHTIDTQSILTVQRQACIQLHNAVLGEVAFRSNEITMPRASARSRE